MKLPFSHPWFKPLAYGLLNIVAASGIVFANKTVFSVYGFKYTAALTLIHTIFTLLGMHIFSYLAAYVAYIVMGNLSLNVNTISFYQIMKIAVAPTVLIIEACFYHKYPSFKVVAAVCVVCIGITAATVTDTQMVNNVHGLLVGCAATVVTALYLIWAGTKQKELKAGSMQLLHQYTPQAALLLGLLVMVTEPVTPSEAHPVAILNFSYTPMAVMAIAVSSLLGLLVSLSTFLVIGATSSLTYNIVGHLKTVIILTGGCLFFGDDISLKKMSGICVAMLGIIWYSQIKLANSFAPAYVKVAPGKGTVNHLECEPEIVVVKTKDVHA